MKDIHKIYETPELRVFQLQPSALIATSVVPGDGTKEGDPVHIASKEFWGSTLFDDEEDAELDLSSQM